MELNKKKPSSLVAKVLGGIALAGVFAVNMMLFVQKDGNNNVSAGKLTASATTCKWKVIDCPGLGTGDYEACLTTGNGNNCTCGEVTRNCPE